MQIIDSNRNYLTSDARRKLVELIYRNGPLTRKDLSAKLGIRQASVNQFVKRLEERGLLKSGRGQNGQGRGRRSMVYKVDPGFRSVLGVHFRKKKLVGVCCNMEGKVLASTTRLPGALNGADDLIDDLSETISELKVLAGIKDKDILAVGLGMPGVVDRNNGVLSHYFEYPWWRNIRVVEQLHRRHELLYSIDNEVRGLATGEHLLGSARGVDNFIYIDAEDGLMMAMVFDGKVIRGQTNSAGEWGHTTIMVDGPKCGCGNRGCLEWFLRTDYIIQRIGELVEQGRPCRLAEAVKSRRSISLSDIISAWKQGDEATETVLSSSFDYLGVGISNLINIFNPSLIVIGGQLSVCGDLMLERVQRAVRLRAYPTLAGATQIRLAALDPVMGAALGAASLVLSEMLDHLAVQAAV